MCRTDVSPRAHVKNILELFFQCRTVVSSHMCKLYTVVDCAIAAYMNLRKTGCLVLETYASRCYVLSFVIAY